MTDLTATFERLVAANIQIVPLPGVAKHIVFERDGFAALVERTPDGFGQAGSSGILSEKGLAVLVWRGTQGFFVGKGFEQPAEPSQVEQLRQFAADLEAALR